MERNVHHEGRGSTRRGIFEVRDRSDWVGQRRVESICISILRLTRYLEESLWSKSTNYDHGNSMMDLRHVHTARNNLHRFVDDG